MPTDNNNILRIAVRFVWGGIAEQVNVWHVHAGLLAPMSDTDTLEAVNEWLENVYSIVKPDMANNVIHSDTQVYNETVGYPLTPLGANPDLNGVNTNNSLSPQQSALLVMRTLVSRRQGRKYLPTYTVVAMGDGVWDAAVVTRLNDLGSNLLLPYDASNPITLTPGVMPTTGGAFTTFSGYSVSTRPTDLDSRKPRLGL